MVQDAGCLWQVDRIAVVKASHKLLRRAQQKEARVRMTWVNAGEVAYLVERRFGLAQLQAALERVPAARELALLAAHLKAGHPIAYADAIAAALAQQAAATLVTGDPEFKKLAGAADILWLSQGEP